MITTAQIISQARKYIGTPFRHQARVLGLGVDCVGLVLCVAEDLGLHDVNGAPLLRTDYSNYPMEPQRGDVQKECALRFRRELLTNIQPGFVVTMKIPIEPCHAGIVSNCGDELFLIHAYNAGPMKVVEHRIDETWLRRITGVFSFPEVS